MIKIHHLTWDIINYTSNVDFLFKNLQPMIIIIALL